MLVLGGQLPVSVRKTLLMQVLSPLVQYMCLLTCIWRYVSRTFSLIRLNGGVRLSLFQINTYLPHVPMSVESSARRRTACVKNIQRICLQMERRTVITNRPKLSIKNEAIGSILTTYH